MDWIQMDPSRAVQVATVLTPGDDMELCGTAPAPGPEDRFRFLKDRKFSLRHQSKNFSHPSESVPSY